MAIAHPRDWRPGTSQWFIAEQLVKHNFDRKKAFALGIRPAVGRDPLIFSGTLADGTYGPFPLTLPGGDENPRPYQRAWYRTGDVLKAIREHGWDPSEVPADETTPEPEEAPTTPEPEAPNADLIPQDLTVVPTPSVPADLKDRAELLYAEIQRARAFVRGRDKMESLDSMRAMIDGIKALKAGVPVEALISGMTMPWSAETRAQFAKYRPNPSDLKPVMPEGIYDYASFAPRPSEFAHATAGYVASLVMAGIPVWLYGPAGTGKSSAARYAAKAAGLDYYEVNLAGAMVSAVKGKDRMKSFVQSDFMRALRYGGVVCLEEFSAAHPSVGTALNTALAADFFHNDADDTDYGYGPGVIKKHPNFRVVVTDNSLGYGCPIFKRSALDAATLDRFRMGRVYQGLDLTLERNIFNSILMSDLPAIVREVREDLKVAA